MTPCDWFVGDYAPKEEVHIPMETLSEVDGGTYACTVVHICLTLNTEVILNHYTLQ